MNIRNHFLFAMLLVSATPNLFAAAASPTPMDLSDDDRSYTPEQHDILIQAIHHAMTPPLAQTPSPVDFSFDRSHTPTYTPTQFDILRAGIARALTPVAAPKQKKGRGRKSKKADVTQPAQTLVPPVLFRSLSQEFELDGKESKSPFRPGSAQAMFYLPSTTPVSEFSGDSSPGRNSTTPMDDEKALTPTEIYFSLHNITNAGYLDKLVKENKQWIDTRDEQGQTLFFIAIINGNTLLAEALRCNGADINVQDKNGDTPVLVAIRQGQQAGYSYLASKKARMDLANYSGISVARELQQRAANVMAQMNQFYANGGSVPTSLGQ